MVPALVMFGIIIDFAIKVTEAHFPGLRSPTDIFGPDDDEGEPGGTCAECIPKMAEKVDTVSPSHEVDGMSE